jgi:hypothetical protein
MMDDSTAYDRGLAAGEIQARLNEHDRRLDKINGSMQAVATHLSTLTIQIQHIADAMAADRATVITTATALEKERDSTARAVEKTRIDTRDRTDRRWSPYTRIALVLGILVSVAIIIATVASLR